MIGASDGAGSAQLRLSEWARHNSEDSDVAASLYRATMHADLAGQLFVRAIEVPEAQPTRALADTLNADAFLNLTFEEALQSFLDRHLISPDEFRRLSDDARVRAFTATRLASMQLAERAKRLLVDALDSGDTLQSFARQLQDEEVSLGVTPSDSGYLETVYRTNVSASYGAGRYRQLRSPAVRAARPFVQYRTAKDQRVRPSHAALDGLCFNQEDPDWTRYAPPNGYNCRCVVVALAEPRGRVVSASDLSEQPDEGFNAAPAVELTE